MWWWWWYYHWVRVYVVLFCCVVWWSLFLHSIYICTSPPCLCTSPRPRSAARPPPPHAAPKRPLALFNLHARGIDELIGYACGFGRARRRKKKSWTPTFIYIQIELNLSQTHLPSLARSTAVPVSSPTSTSAILGVMYNNNVQPHVFVCVRIFNESIKHMPHKIIQLNTTQLNQSD